MAAQNVRGKLTKPLRDAFSSRNIDSTVRSTGGNLSLGVVSGVLVEKGIAALLPKLAGGWMGFTVVSMAVDLLDINRNGGGLTRQVLDDTLANYTHIYGQSFSREERMALMHRINAYLETQGKEPIDVEDDATTAYVMGQAHQQAILQEIPPPAGCYRSDHVEAGYGYVGTPSDSCDTLYLQQYQEILAQSQSRTRVPTHLRSAVETDALNEEIDNVAETLIQDKANTEWETFWLPMFIWIGLTVLGALFIVGLHFQLI
jgi:hypothetical protein